MKHNDWYELEHPTRALILEALAKAPISVKEAAAVSGVSWSKARYHLFHLQHTGHIRVVGTRTNATGRGANEYLYGATVNAHDQ